MRRGDSPPWVDDLSDAGGWGLLLSDLGPSSSAPNRGCAPIYAQAHALKYLKVQNLFGLCSLEAHHVEPGQAARDGLALEVLFGASDIKRSEANTLWGWPEVERLTEVAAPATGIVVAFCCSCGCGCGGGGGGGRRRLPAACPLPATDHPLRATTAAAGAVADCN